jgi:hypothetical protein
MLLRGRLDGAEYAILLGLCSAVMALWVLVNYLCAASPHIYEGLRYARPVALSFYAAAIVTLVIRRLRDAGVGIRPLFEQGVAASTYWRLIYLCVMPFALIYTLWNGPMTSLQVSPALAWLMSIAFFADVSPPDSSRRDWTTLLVKIVSMVWLLVEIAHELVWRSTPNMLGNGVSPGDITALIKLGIISAMPMVMIALALVEWTRHGRQGRKSAWAEAFAVVASIGMISTALVTILFCLLPFTGTLIRGVPPELDEQTIRLIVSGYSTAANVQMAALAVAPLLIAKMFSGPTTGKSEAAQQRQKRNAVGDRFAPSPRTIFGRR